LPGKTGVLTAPRCRAAQPPTGFTPATPASPARRPYGSKPLPTIGSCCSTGIATAVWFGALASGSSLLASIW
jgi:hypothetical protein